MLAESFNLDCLHLAAVIALKSGGFQEQVNQNGGPLYLHIYICMQMLYTLENVIGHGKRATCPFFRELLFIQR